MESIKSNEVKRDPSKLPKLMIDDNTIVLVTRIYKENGDRISGFVVHSESSFQIGFPVEGWSLDHFEDFSGKVTLFNSED